jgi:hypothetical protein
LITPLHLTPAALENLKQMGMRKLRRPFPVGQLLRGLVAFGGNKLDRRFLAILVVNQKDGAILGSTKVLPQMKLIDNRSLRLFVRFDQPADSIHAGLFYPHCFPVVTPRKTCRLDGKVLYAVTRTAQF